MTWNNFINSIWKAPDAEGKATVSVPVRPRYEMNLQLTDLRRQPEHIIDAIDSAINESLDRERKRMVASYFVKFCGKYRLPKLAQNPHAIVTLLSAPYDI